MKFRMAMIKQVVALIRSVAGVFDGAVYEPSVKCRRPRRATRAGPGSLRAEHHFHRLPAAA